MPGTPFVPPNPNFEIAERAAMRQPPYGLDELRRVTVLATIREVCKHRRWRLQAAHVRSNHVHVVVGSTAPPEKVMSDLKAWCSRRLRETFDEAVDRDRWTQHGSTRYLNDSTSVSAAIDYVLEEQGVRMAAFDGRDNKNDHEPEA